MFDMLDLGKWEKSTFPTNGTILLTSVCFAFFPRTQLGHQLVDFLYKFNYLITLVACCRNASVSFQLDYHMVI